MLKLEDVWPVLLCSAVLTTRIMSPVDECSDAVVTRVLKVVVVRAWEGVCDDAVVS